MGRLREKGLLIVGGKVMQDERCKVAAVPAEMWAALDALAPEPQDESRPAKRGGLLSRFRS